MKDEFNLIDLCIKDRIDLFEEWKHVHLSECDRKKLKEFLLKRITDAALANVSDHELSMKLFGPVSSNQTS